MPMTIAFRRNSGSRPAAAIPTTTALSPASTRSMTMTVKSAVSSEYMCLDCSDASPSSGWYRSCHHDQLFALEVAAPSWEDFRLPSVEYVVNFVGGAMARNGARRNRRSKRNLERRWPADTEQAHLDGSSAKLSDLEFHAALLRPVYAVAARPFDT